MAQNGLVCADVPLRNYSLTHSVNFPSFPPDNHHSCCKLDVSTYSSINIPAVKREVISAAVD